MNSQKLERIMDALGFPELMAGTRYLRFMVNRYSPGKAITKECYPECAEHYNTSAASVERSARYAIKEASHRGGKYWAVCFGNSIDPSRGVPTVGEFLAKVALMCAD